MWKPGFSFAEQGGTGVGRETWLDAGLADTVTEVVKAAVESALGEGAKSVVAHFAGSWAQDIVHDTVKALGGNLAGLLLQTLLKKTDATVALLEKQVQAPFRTGARVAMEAMELAAASPEQREFRDKLIGQALLELERAYSLAEGTPNAAAQQFQIRLLQGLAAVRHTGAGQYAVTRLQGCSAVLTERIDAIQARIRELTEAGVRLQAKAERQSRENEQVRLNPPPWLDGRVDHAATVGAWTAHSDFEEARRAREMSATLEVQREGLERVRLVVDAALLSALSEPHAQ